MTLEIQQIWVVAGVVSIVSGLLVMAVRKRYEGNLGRALNFWGATCVSLGVGFGLAASGVPHLKSEMWGTRMSPLLAPALVVLGLTLEYVAVTELKRQTRQLSWMVGPALAMFLVYAWLGFGKPSVLVALVLLDAIEAVLLVRVAACFVARENGRRFAVDMTAGGVNLLLALSTVWVAVDEARHLGAGAAYALTSTAATWHVTAMVVAQGALFVVFLLAMLERLNLDFKYQATHDPVTNLLNRRALEEMGKDLVLTATRAKQPLSIFLIDIDNFKQLNDRYGHAIGDFLLRSSSEALLQGLREEDTLGRWGSDEFCVLMPGATREHAGSIAERILKLFEEADHVVDGESVSLRVNLGMVTEDGENRTFSSLLKLADAALYEAKAPGLAPAVAPTVAPAVRADASRGARVARVELA